MGRYKMCCPDTWPVWAGSDKEGCQKIMASVGVGESEYRLGHTKLFVKEASTLTKLEKKRGKEMEKVSVIIQRAWRKLAIKGKLVKYLRVLQEHFPKSWKPTYDLTGYKKIPTCTDVAGLSSYSLEMMKKYFLLAKALSLTPRWQAVVRHKLKLLDMFKGKKPYEIGMPYEPKQSWNFLVDPAINSKSRRWSECFRDVHLCSLFCCSLGGASALTFICVLCTLRTQI
jgi:hypothetical protein